MRTTFLVKVAAALACWALLGSVQAQEGDAAAGSGKFDTCLGCHGIPGYTNVYPTYYVPRLGGQNPQYIIAALKAYKSGERNHATMHANASTLSEQDMADVAAFIASVKVDDDPPPVVGNAEAGEKKNATCKACHGADGKATQPIYPNLSGQYEDYLIHALTGYKTGKRKNPIMMGMAQLLSEQDIADLAAFYASQSDWLTFVEYSPH